MKIVDIKEMPNYNAVITNGNDSVSTGKVFIKKGTNFPACIRHGALLKVSAHGIWRCGELGCDNGCFQIAENKKIEAWDLKTDDTRN